jgi:hypothetical protein
MFFQIEKEIKKKEKEKENVEVIDKIIEIFKNEKTLYILDEVDYLYDPLK